MRARAATALPPFALALVGAIAASSARAQQAPADDHPIAGLDERYPPIAWQSSDLREDTAAGVAAPSLHAAFVVPSETTPAYTRTELDPWWQVDLRVRRHVSTVAARGCEGHLDNGASGPHPDPTGALPAIACNLDYDLAGAWVLASDVPFPADPWAVSVPNDPGATVSRFPIVGNGYREDQRADVHRAARYLRVQFPPGTRRALALERLDVLGRQGLTDPVVELGATLGPAFAETEALLAHLERYRDEAALVAVELGRLQDSGVRLQRGTREAASIAGRVDRLDRNLARAIRLLGKASVISQLKGPARSMKRTLEGVRRTVRPLKTAANRARDALKGTERRLGDANRTLLRSRARLAGTVAWSAVETTSVAGIQRCEADAASSGARPALSPVEGYSAARNAQFELTGLNDRAHELAGSVRTVNDGVRDAEDAFSALARFESRLAGLEGALNGLLAPLGHVERVLGQRICVRIPLVGNRCTSVDDVLRAIQDGKDLVGLSFLEDRVDALIDPIVGEVLAPLRRALPAVPAFPAIDLALPDPGAPIRHLHEWDAGATSLQAALDTPAIPGCAAARDAMGRAPLPAPTRPGGA